MIRYVDLILLVSRRLVEASQEGARRLPLVAAPGFGAIPSDLSLLVLRAAQQCTMLALARAYMAVRWDRTSRPRISVGNSSGTGWPDEAWMAVRLACLPWPLNSNQSIPADDAMVNRLAAGDGAGACDIALRDGSARQAFVPRCTRRVPTRTLHDVGAPRWLSPSVNL